MATFKIAALFFLVAIGLLKTNPVRQNREIKLPILEQTQSDDTLSFEEQLKVFNSLGYRFNTGINKTVVFENMKRSYLPGTDLEQEFKKSKFVLLYYYLGWSHSFPPVYYTDNCIWYDLEFIDPSTEYITFMKRMGTITKGELTYSDITLSVDSKNYEWIDFKVNGISKKWKLAPKGYVDDSFFQRFSNLTTEFKTKGRYTYFDDGGQQFVIDYATPVEQKEFIEKTGLKREWLGEGNHFSEHDPTK
jgi:hypothetical protein